MRDAWRLPVLEAGLNDVNSVDPAIIEIETRRRVADDGWLPNAWSLTGSGE